jgi:protein TonB
MRVISGPKPEYTEEAKKMGIEGSVVLRVTVGATGQISVLAVLHSLGHGLDEAAKRAVARYNIKPAARSGVPVEETTTITVTFQIA